MKNLWMHHAISSLLKQDNEDEYQKYFTTFSEEILFQCVKKRE